MREPIEGEPPEVDLPDTDPTDRPWAPYGLIAMPAPFLGFLCLIGAVLAVVLANTVLPGETRGGFWTYGCYAVAALLLYAGTRCWLGRFL